MATAPATVLLQLPVYTALDTVIAEFAGISACVMAVAVGQAVYVTSTHWAAAVLAAMDNINQNTRGPWGCRAPMVTVVENHKVISQCSRKVRWRARYRDNVADQRSRTCPAGCSTVALSGGHAGSHAGFIHLEHACRLQGVVQAVVASLTCRSNPL
jgi:hypothetical protein